MFDSPADAQAALAAFLKPPAIEQVVKLLQPAVTFKFTKGDVPVGGTKFGGTPDLPKGTDWPRPPAPPDAEAIAKRGNADAGEAMRRHLALNLPYAFVAQIDLAEVAAVGKVAAPLPADGRLLFFYDFSVGPWETGERVARVIWDRTPKGELERLSTPADMAAEAAREHQEATDIAKEYKLPLPAPDEGGNFGAPQVVAVPKVALVAPPLAAIEGHSIPEAEHDAYSEAYDSFHYALQEKLRTNRSQMLGPPEPEQDDPRYMAAALRITGTEYPEREERAKHRAEIHAMARDMVLLFQLDPKAWAQSDLMQGTVYFLIDRTDLEQRRFDKVIAVYQQT
ncbi:DUF1963 domain-containing protein [Xanthobacteraceae bacterium A53D]